MNAILKTLGILLVMGFVVFPSVSHGYIGPDGQSNATDAAGNFLTSETADIWIINVTGSTASKGSVMCVSTVEDDGYRASECSVEGGQALCVLPDSCTDLSRCKCRQHGYVSQVNWVDSGTGTEDATAGRCLYVSGDDSGAVQGIAGDSAILSGTERNCLGVFLDSDAADDAAVEAYINIR